MERASCPTIADQPATRWKPEAGRFRSEFRIKCVFGFRGLEDIEPITVAAYVEQHPGSPATIKQHMSAIRMLFSWLTEKGILAMNPAREVKTKKFSRREGKTPAFDTEPEIRSPGSSTSLSRRIIQPSCLSVSQSRSTISVRFGRLGRIIALARGSPKR
jgi:hypothetical protein